MIEKIKELWDELDAEAVVNKRELCLGLLVCTLAGILMGIMISPKKRVMIGCYNGDYMMDDAEQDEIE
ncbi:MAG: hypothetical protein HFH10_00760 [Dorea sp.]|nr:hypothetical protein [Dorea sp.]